MWRVKNCHDVNCNGQFVNLGLNEIKINGTLIKAKIFITAHTAKFGYFTSIFIIF